MSVVERPVFKTAGNDAAASLGYREEGNRWYVYRIPQLSLLHKSLFEKHGMQVYLPTYRTKTFVRGKAVDVERPKVLNYMFVLTDIGSVEHFRTLQGISPVRKHHTGDEVVRRDDFWLTVPFSQMHSLMLVVQGLDREVEFCEPQADAVERGDCVYVAAGRFKGVKGVLLQTKGKRDGRVCVSIASDFGILTDDIPDRYLQIISFSRSCNHFTRRMQAFEQILEQAYDARQTGGTVTPVQKEAIGAFLFRYRLLTGLTHASFARLQILRYAAYALLGDSKKADECIAVYVSETENSKSGRLAARRSPAADEYMKSWMTRLRDIA